ncbi:MAG: GmrSD restriction endonuclease domain-containing protein, partial [Bryobacteraceae bacterium]
AAGTARRTPYFRSHSPGVIVALQETAPDIPAPAYGDERAIPPPPPPRAIALTTPRALFSKVDYELSHLLSAVETGEIGLPDLQRPFVWSAAKVRDLFDSMYRGFPVGYLLFWSNSELQNAKAIGVDTKQRRVPRLVIVDGQQRLTSLYAVLKGKSVLDDEFVPTKIEIAFRPRDGLFEVTDAAIRRDAEYIPSISDVWAPGATSWTVVNRFFAQLEARRELTAEDKEAMSRNLDRLFDLQRYSFTSLEIMADVSESAIADIFVRINSQGVKLNQADFLLTLLSVFWQEGRAALENFARQSSIPPAAAGKPSAFNYIIQPSPDQILRVSVATGFHRARLRSVYQVLRGKDVESGQFSETKRDEQFARLQEAQENVLNLNYWHDYLSCLRHAGYRGAEMISSESAVIYGYAVYLLGRLQCQVPPHQLTRLISRWFVMSSVTARYSGSAESIMEEDLGRFKPTSSPAQFAEVIDATIGRVLTPDFWTINLPADLESSSSRAPAFLAFLAAQCALGAPVLFSDKKVRDVLDPALRPSKKAIDRHHLFPKGWLHKQGIADNKFQNQVANLSYVEWPDNLS